MTAVPLRQLRRLVAYNGAHFFHAWGHKLRGTGNLTFHTTGAKTQLPAHDYKSVVEDFLAWGMASYGIKVDYSTGYEFRNGIVHSVPWNSDHVIKINGSKVGI